MTNRTEQKLPATQRGYASRADRVTSFELADIAIPTGREEDWRFTPIERFHELFDPGKIGSVSPEVKVSGPSEVVAEDVTRNDERLGRIGAPGDRTSAVAWSAFSQAHIITIAEGQQVLQPVVVDITGTSLLPACQHFVVRAGRGSSATIVFNHVGQATLTQTIEIELEEGADLAVAAVHEWDSDAIHATNHRIRIGKDARLRHIMISFGGQAIRASIDQEFSGPGGDSELLGVYFVGAGQHLEHRPFVHHNQPNCRSRVTYKGALQGDKAHAVWVGDCLIGQNSDGTDTYELNRNLVLTDGTFVDSVPNLEIENGEIAGAGHASATGRFDDEQLFYLMSRGISSDAARRLVVRGFFTELIDQIGIPALQDHLMQAVQARLDRGGN